MLKKCKLFKGESILFNVHVVVAAKYIQVAINGSYETLNSFPKAAAQR